MSPTVPCAQYVVPLDWQAGLVEVVREADAGGAPHLISLNVANRKGVARELLAEML